jgi:hypothetical protein
MVTKAKPARAAGVVILHDLDIRYGAKTLESILEIILSGVEGKISYVESHGEFNGEQID